MAKNVLPGPLDLIKEAWALFLLRWKTIVGIYLAGILLFVALGLFVVLLFGLGAVSIFAFDQLNAVSIAIAVLVSLVVIAIMVMVGTWWQGALLLSYIGSDKKVTFSECFKQARGFIIPLFVTSLLSGFILLGSYFVFLIPGLLFTIWFSFSELVVVDQQKKNFSALQTSRELFRGRFWSVLWRMVAIYVPFFVLGIIIGMMGDSDASKQLEGLMNLVSTLLTPLFGMYSYILYRHLKGEKAITTVPSNTRALYVGTAVVGYVLMALFISTIMATAGPVIQEYQEQMKKEQKQLEATPGDDLPEDFEALLNDSTI